MIFSSAKLIGRNTMPPLSPSSKKLEGETYFLSERRISLKLILKNRTMPSSPCFRASSSKIGLQLIDMMSHQ